MITFEQALEQIQATLMPIRRLNYTAVADMVREEKATYADVYELVKDLSDTQKREIWKQVQELPEYQELLRCDQFRTPRDYTDMAVRSVLNRQMMDAQLAFLEKHLTTMREIQDEM